MSKTGWAAGIADSGGWFTVVGSYHRGDLVYPTPEQARERADTIRRHFPDVTVREVREVYHPDVASGRAYRLTEAD